MELGRFYTNHEAYHIKFNPEIDSLHKAFQLFKQAYDLRYTPVSYELGMCYEEGLGTKKDPKLAEQCFMEGSAKGDIRCMEKAVNYMLIEA